MTNANPTNAKKNQKILKIGLIAAACVLLIGIIFLFTNDPKRQDFIEKQEVKNKLEATNRGKEASAYMTVLMHHAVHYEDLKFLNHFFSSWS